MNNKKDELYLALGQLCFKKLDSLAQTEDVNAPELDFFLSDGAVLELLNLIASELSKSQPAPPLHSQKEKNIQQPNSSINPDVQPIVPVIQTPVPAQISVQPEQTAQYAIPVPIAVQPVIKEIVKNLCPHCGKELRNNAKFCLNCGQKV